MQTCYIEPMRILFLDDDWDRHSHFTMQNLGADIVHANTVGIAIEALGGRRFDEAWLDHDLELQLAPVTRWFDRAQVYTPPRLWPEWKYECGLDVARHIARMPVDRRPRHVDVHSVNTVGASNMMRALELAKVPATRIDQLRYDQALKVRAA